MPRRTARRPTKRHRPLITREEWHAQFVAKMQCLPKMQALLRERNLTIYAVSRATGQSHAHLVKVFRGVHKPRVETALPVCAYLGIRLDEFYALLD